EARLLAEVEHVPLVDHRGDEEHGELRLRRALPAEAIELRRPVAEEDVPCGGRETGHVRISPSAPPPRGRRCASSRRGRACATRPRARCRRRWTPWRGAWPR